MYVSIRKTREELYLATREKAASILPSVYELRFLKILVEHYDHEASFWVYMGLRSDYVIIPGTFCSCKDFIIRTAINKTSAYCKHLLGQYIASREGKYITLRVSPSEAAGILLEILNHEYSTTVRKKLGSSK